MEMRACMDLESHCLYLPMVKLIDNSRGLLAVQSLERSAMDFQEVTCHAVQDIPR